MGMGCGWLERWRWGGEVRGVGEVGEEEMGVVVWCVCIVVVGWLVGVWGS